MYAKTPDGLPSLNAAWNDPGSRVLMSFMFVDVENSTKMQAQEPEASWLPQTAFFYDLCDKLIAESPFSIYVKFLGDGIMLTCDTEDATAMVNLAISLQEAIRRNGPRPDGSPGAIAFNVSIGIVTGTAIRFLAPDGLVDFVGKTTSTARRLCDAATARAIFIDTTTAGSIVPVRICSEIGRVQGREYAEYLGDVSQTEAKGLSSPVQYYEVLWESNRFGRKNDPAPNPSAPVSEVPPGNQRGPTKHAPLAAAGGSARPERFSGRVKTWGADKEFGFITSDQGEEFFFNKRLLAYDEDMAELRPGVRVAFTTLPPVSEGKLRRAAVVLLDGKEATGKAFSPPTQERPYGWIEVLDDFGTAHLVHVSGADWPASVPKGSEVDFTIRVSNKGASAIDIAAAQDAEPTGAAA